MRAILCLAMRTSCGPHWQSLLALLHVASDVGTDRRYENMMDYLCKLVVDLDGSLKAEHGTGRNVAPYVEMEWGAKATSVMWEVKKLFDAEDLLNPGVVLNKNNKVHACRLLCRSECSDLFHLTFSFPCSGVAATDQLCLLAPCRCTCRT